MHFQKVTGSEEKKKIEIEKKKKERKGKFIFFSGFLRI